MDTKKLLMGTVVGGLVYFFLGFITYALLLGDFFIAHAGSATGVPKTEMYYWPLMLGDFAQAGLLSFIFIKWGEVHSFKDGAKAGLIIGFLMTLGFDMIQYDTTNIMDLTAALTDVVAYSIITAIVGGIVALLTRKTS